MFLGFFRVEEGIHLIWVRAAQHYVWCVGGCQKGQFCFSFSFPLIPLNSGHMSESTHQVNRKLCIFFLSLSEFPAGFPCWADSLQSCGVTGAVAGSPEWCWGDVMFCQIDVTPVQSLLGLHAMRCNTQWLPSSEWRRWRRNTGKNSTMWK